MNIGKLKKILDLMDERGIAEIEVRSVFRTVRISRAAAGANVSFISAGPVDPALAPAGKAAAPLPAGEAAAVIVLFEHNQFVSPEMLEEQLREQAVSAGAYNADPFEEMKILAVLGYFVVVADPLQQ